MPGENEKIGNPGEVPVQQGEEDNPGQPLASSNEAQIAAQIAAQIKTALEPNLDVPLFIKALEQLSEVLQQEGIEHDVADVAVRTEQIVGRTFDKTMVDAISSELDKSNYKDRLLFKYFPMIQEGLLQEVHSDEDESELEISLDLSDVDEGLGDTAQKSKEKPPRYVLTQEKLNLSSNPVLMIQEDLLQEVHSDEDESELEISLDSSDVDEELGDTAQKSKAKSPRYVLTQEKLNLSSNPVLMSLQMSKWENIIKLKPGEQAQTAALQDFMRCSLLLDGKGLEFYLLVEAAKIIKEIEQKEEKTEGKILKLVDSQKKALLIHAFKDFASAIPEGKFPDSPKILINNFKETIKNIQTADLISYSKDIAREYESSDAKEVIIIEAIKKYEKELSDIFRGEEQGKGYKEILADHAFENFNYSQLIEKFHCQQLSYPLTQIFVMESFDKTNITMRNCAKNTDVDYVNTGGNLSNNLHVVSLPFVKLHKRGEVETIVFPGEINLAYNFSESAPELQTISCSNAVLNAWIMSNYATCSTAGNSNSEDLSNYFDRANELASAEEEINKLLENSKCTAEIKEQAEKFLENYAVVVKAAIHNTADLEVLTKILDSEDVNQPGLSQVIKTNNKNAFEKLNAQLAKAAKNAQQHALNIFAKDIESFEKLLEDKIPLKEIGNQVVASLRKMHQQLELSNSNDYDELEKNADYIHKSLTVCQILIHLIDDNKKAVWDQSKNDYYRSLVQKLGLMGRGCDIDAFNNFVQTPSLDIWRQIVDQKLKLWYTLDRILKIVKYLSDDAHEIFNEIKTSSKNINSMDFINFLESLPWYLDQISIYFSYRASDSKNFIPANINEFAIYHIEKKFPLLSKAIKNFNFQYCLSDDQLSKVAHYFKQLSEKEDKSAEDLGNAKNTLEQIQGDFLVLVRQEKYENTVKALHVEDILKDVMVLSEKVPLSEFPVLVEVIRQLARGVTDPKFFLQKENFEYLTGKVQQAIKSTTDRATKTKWEKLGISLLIFGAIIAVATLVALSLVVAAPAAIPLLTTFVAPFLAKIGGAAAVGAFIAAHMGATAVVAAGVGKAAIAMTGAAATSTLPALIGNIMRFFGRSNRKALVGKMEEFANEVAQNNSKPDSGAESTKDLDNAVQKSQQHTAGVPTTNS